VEPFLARFDGGCMMIFVAANWVQNKYYMSRHRTALRESKIKIVIHKLITSDGGWEKQIGLFGRFRRVGE
jgi:hypothetical protein